MGRMSATIPPWISTRRIARESSGTCAMEAGRAPALASIPMTWEEGSHRKEYTYKKTGGTGKYEGLSGGGTYMYESLTDKLFGGRYKDKLELP